MCAGPQDWQDIPCDGHRNPMVQIVMKTVGKGAVAEVTCKQRSYFPINSSHLQLPSPKYHTAAAFLKAWTFQLSVMSQARV